MVREMKHTEIGDIPVDWELQTFEETFRILSNNTLSRENLNNRGGLVRNVHYGDILTKFSEVLDCAHDEIPYLNDISLLTSSAQLLQDGDIIIADTAEDETVGKATEISGLGDERMVAGLHTIPCRVKKGDFASGWLGYYLNSHLFHDQVLPYATGIKVSSISKSAINETLIVIPPKPEQEKIVSVLTDIENEMQSIVALIEKKRAIKIGAMQNLLYGRSRIPAYVRSDRYKSTEIGLLPDEWETSPLTEMADLLNGLTYSPNDLCENGLLVLRSSNVQNARIDLKDRVFVACDVLPDKLVHADDILVCVRNGSAALLGKCAKIPSGLYATFGAFMAILRSDDSEFIFQLLSLGNIQRDIMKNKDTQINQITNEDFKNIIVPKPDKPERDAIAQILADMDNEIFALENKMDKLIMIKRGVVSELITGKTRLI